MTAKKVEKRIKEADGHRVVVRLFETTESAMDMGEPPTIKRYDSGISMEPSPEELEEVYNRYMDFGVDELRDVQSKLHEVSETTNLTEEEAVNGKKIVKKVNAAEASDGHRRRITYDIVTPESAEQGDVFDREEGITVVDKTVEYLLDNGATMPSSSSFSPGNWYSSEGDTDMQTGGNTTRSFHLIGYSPEEEEAVYNRITDQGVSETRASKMLGKVATNIKKLMSRISALPGKQTDSSQDTRTVPQPFKGTVLYISSDPSRWPKNATKKDFERFAKLFAQKFPGLKAVVGPKADACTGPRAEEVKAAANAVWGKSIKAVYGDSDVDESSEETKYTGVITDVTNEGTIFVLHVDDESGVPHAVYMDHRMAQQLYEAEGELVGRDVTVTESRFGESFVKFNDPGEDFMATAGIEDDYPRPTKRPPGGPRPLPVTAAEGEPGWDPEEEEYTQCPTCEGPGVLMGQLGRRKHFRCQNCGMDFSTENPDWGSGNISNRSKSLTEEADAGELGDTDLMGINASRRTADEMLRPGRYVDLLKRGQDLVLRLTDEGREFLQEHIESEEDTTPEAPSSMDDDAWRGEHASTDIQWDTVPNTLLYDLLEDHLGNGWDLLSDEDLGDIGALTSAPVLTSDVLRNDDDGHITEIGDVYWFPNYAVTDEVGELYKTGEVVFDKAPSSEPEDGRTVESSRRNAKGAEWEGENDKHKGELHKYFGIPEGKHIPTAMLKKEMARLHKEREDMGHLTKKDLHVFHMVDAALKRRHAKASQRTAATWTPWGRSQTQKKIAPGIMEYSTAGHGGFAVADTVAMQMPEPLRSIGFRSAGRWWFEEDVDWVAVPLAFPQYFDEKTLQAAEKSLKNWNPEAWEAWKGEELSLEESSKKRERKFYENYANDYVVTTAWGSWAKWVPEGMVGVYATIGGTRKNPEYSKGKYFLIPKEDYNTENFVVDPSKYEEVSDPDSFTSEASQSHGGSLRARAAGRTGADKWQQDADNGMQVLHVDPEDDVTLVIDEDPFEDREASRRKAFTVRRGDKQFETKALQTLKKLYAICSPQDKEVGVYAIAFYWNLPFKTLSNPFGKGNGFWKNRWTEDRSRDEKIGLFTSEFLYPIQTKVSVALEDGDTDWLVEEVVTPIDQEYDDLEEAFLHSREASLSTQEKNTINECLRTLQEARKNASTEEERKRIEKNIEALHALAFSMEHRSTKAGSKHKADISEELSKRCNEIYAQLMMLEYNCDLSSEQKELMHNALRLISELQSDLTWAGPEMFPRTASTQVPVTRRVAVKSSTGAFNMDFGVLAPPDQVDELMSQASERLSKKLDEVKREHPSDYIPVITEHWEAILSEVAVEMGGRFDHNEDGIPRINLSKGSEQNTEEDRGFGGPEGTGGINDGHNWMSDNMPPLVARRVAMKIANADLKRSFSVLSSPETNAAHMQEVQKALVVKLETIKAANPKGWADEIESRWELLCDEVAGTLNAKIDFDKEGDPRFNFSGHTLQGSNSNLEGVNSELLSILKELVDDLSEAIHNWSEDEEKDGWDPIEEKDFDSLARARALISKIEKESSPGEETPSRRVTRLRHD